MTVYGPDGKPLGHQRPRLSHLPIRFSSAGQAAVDLAAVAGLHLDPWQQWVVMEILGEKENDWYYNEVLGCQMRRSSAYESALIVARQNGKGSIMEALELAWLFVLGAKTIVHSAHEFATSKEHFQRIESLVSGTPELRGELARGGIKWSHGDESINLRNGQRLLFKTRTKGAARGFSIDKLVMDEAMILKSDAVAAMTFATSARPDVQIVYAGSAGDKESEHFGRARQRGIEGTDPRLFFAEWSADTCNDFCLPDCEDHDKPGDPEVWAKANPGMGIRLQEENIGSEFRGVDREVFLRERLSVGDWPVEGDEWKIITKEQWMARVNEVSTLDTSKGLVLAIDASPGPNVTCSISVAGENEQGENHVEVTSREQYDHRPGTQWVVPRVLELWKTHRPLAVVIDKVTQAGTFVPELEEAGVRLLHPNSREFAQACGDFYLDVVPRKESVPNLVHLNQEPLNTAVAGADKRDLTDMWAWSKRLASSDISPLVSCTLAAWGFKQVKHEKKAAAPWVVRR